jgi:uncharacterized membrane protein HdeD (DUF308 family)
MHTPLKEIKFDILRRMEMATMEVTATQAQTKQSPWWLTLVEGILALVIGGIMLWAPAKDKIEVYQLLVAVLGLWWLVDGIFKIVSIFIDHSMWGWKLFIGIIGIMAGAYVLMYPIAAAIALPKIFVLVLGIWGLIYGFSLLFMAFRGAGWGAGILGALGIIFGFALIANYAVVGMGLTMLWTASVFAVVGGIALIVLAFRQKSA